MLAIENTSFPLTEVLSGVLPERLRRQVVGDGYFYVEQHGVAAALHQQAKDLAMEFFLEAPAGAKQALKPLRKDVRRGFSELGAESTAIVTNSGDYSDYSMCYSMGGYANVFPSEKFEAIWTRYYKELERLAIVLARAILHRAGGCGDAIDEELRRCDPLLRFRYFPEVPDDRVAERVPMRMASHYDLSILTLIQQTPCANGFTSLRAHVRGEVVDLPPRDDAILVLCGAIANVASRCALPAPRHYVASPPADKRIGSARTSSVFFLRPSPAFSFSVQEARNCGLDVTLQKERATFAEWIGMNYTAMHTGE